MDKKQQWFVHDQGMHCSIYNESNQCIAMVNYPDDAFKIVELYNKSIKPKKKRVTK
jgi:hypothetical protein